MRAISTTSSSDRLPLCWMFFSCVMQGVKPSALLRQQGATLVSYRLPRSATPSKLPCYMRLRAAYFASVCCKAPRGECPTHLLTVALRLLQRLDHQGAGGGDDGHLHAQEQAV
jgi:hypothetical protein